MGYAPLRSVISLLTFFLGYRGCSAATFTITNNCGYMVWPGTLSNAGTAQLSSTGFPLDQGESRILDVPPSWSGSLWGRTLCSTDASTGAFSCATGDCSSGKVECSGRRAAPPATLAEFTLDGSGGMDLYDVSLVDAYNIPVLVTPQGAAVGGAGGNCTATGCLVDLNVPCPTELNVYDDATSKFACPTGVDYVITFCGAGPNRHSTRSRKNRRKHGPRTVKSSTDRTKSPRSIDRAPSASQFDLTASPIIVWSLMALFIFRMITAWARRYFNLTKKKISFDCEFKLKMKFKV